MGKRPRGWTPDQLRARLFVPASNDTRSSLSVSGINGAKIPSFI
jgi:hypothetical protein